MKQRISSTTKAGDLSTAAGKSLQTGTDTPQGRTLIRFPDVQARTGLSRSTICRLEQQGQFPRHYRISPNAVAWLAEEVAAWIRSRTGEV